MKNRYTESPEGQDYTKDEKWIALQIKILLEREKIHHKKIEKNS